MQARLLGESESGEPPLLCSVGEDPRELMMASGGGTPPPASTPRRQFDDHASKEEQVVHSPDRKQHQADIGSDGDVTAPQPPQRKADGGEDGRRNPHH